jgi:hypothetical protein
VAGPCTPAFFVFSTWFVFLLCFLFSFVLPSFPLAWQVPYKYLPAHFHPFVGWFLFCEYSTIFALGICGFFSFFLFCLGRTIPLPPSSRERLRKLKTPPSIGLFSFLPFGWVSVTGLSLGIWLLHVAMVAHVRTWGVGLWIEAATPHTMLPVHILLWLGLFLWPLNRLFVVCLQNGRRPEYIVLTSSAASSSSSTGGHSHRASIRHHHDSESLEESKVVDRGEDDEFVDLLHPILLC